MESAPPMRVQRFRKEPRSENHSSIRLEQDRRDGLPSRVNPNVQMHPAPEERSRPAHRLIGADRAHLAYHSTFLANAAAVLDADPPVPQMAPERWSPPPAVLVSRLHGRQGFSESGRHLPHGIAHDQHIECRRLSDREEKRSSNQRNGMFRLSHGQAVVLFRHEYFGFRAFSTSKV